MDSALELAPPSSTAAPAGVQPFSSNALRVLEARYLRRDAQGRIVETPAELIERVARAVSEAELAYGKASEAREWEERFSRRMASLDFLPSSPTLMNAGSRGGQLSACFVLPIDDTLESIFGTLRDVALVQRTGGGTGFSFSRLRPHGDALLTTGGIASGPVSFLKVYDSATEHVRQGGRRRGASMGVLRVDHPDIEEFVRVKRDGLALRNFNLSVGVTDEFLSAVEEDQPLTLRHPRDGHAVGRLPARNLFAEICEAAWATGDPGLLFLDTMERGNPTPEEGHLEATNPCGEVPLLPGESCVLGSVNLARTVRDYDGASGVDWERLGATVREAVRFLDDVLTVNASPVPLVTERSLRTRKIGVGVMGFAELCVRLGISYAEPEAVHLARQVMGFIAREATEASASLVPSRGVFPAWERSVHARAGRRLRNATVTSVAPTGTIGLLGGTSSGIEPFFALGYRRHALDGAVLEEINPLLVPRLEEAGTGAARLLGAVLESGRLPRDPSVPEELRRLFVTALDIPAEQHVRVQAVFQEHVDNAVSKTVNLPREATPRDVAAVYRLAHQLGCKGVTVFRYGSMPGQPLEMGLEGLPADLLRSARCERCS